MTARTLPRKAQPPLRPLVNLLAFGAVIVVNALANLLPLGGVSTGEISDSFPSLVTPAGYVFSIWGLIYLLLLGFVVYQALPAQRDNPRLARLGYLFAASCAFNIAWLFAWHYGLFGLTQILMLGLLATLILCYERLRVGRERSAGLERWTIDLPFSVYLGWITVATVANTSILLLWLGVDGGGAAPLWAAFALVAATLVGLLVLRNRRDAAYALVLVWAFVGVAAQQWGLSPSTGIVALAAALVLALAAVWTGLGARRSRSSSTPATGSGTWARTGSRPRRITTGWASPNARRWACDSSAPRPKPTEVCDEAGDAEGSRERSDSERPLSERPTPGSPGFRTATSTTPALQPQRYNPSATTPALRRPHPVGFATRRVRRHPAVAISTRYQ